MAGVLQCPCHRMTLRIRNSQGGCRSGRGLGYFFIPLGFDRNGIVIPLGFIKKVMLVSSNALAIQLPMDFL